MFMFSSIGAAVERKTTSERGIIICLALRSESSKMLSSSSLLCSVNSLCSSEARSRRISSSLLRQLALGQGLNAEDSKEMHSRHG